MGFLRCFSSSRPSTAAATAAADLRAIPAAAGALLRPLGVVAGRGVYPLEICRAARRAGVPRIVAISLIDEAAPELAALADQTVPMHVGQLRRTIRALQAAGVPDVVFAGQVRPGRLFGGFRPDFLALRLLWSLKERNAHTLFGAIANAFEQAGLHVLPATTYMDHWLAGEGTLGRRKPNRAQLRDIEFGTRIARQVGALDIGQTVVVRNGTVLAVEGFEGTDQAIRRGGELGRGKVTVVKVAKPGHDLRFDVPCIGMNTVEALIAAGARTLAVHAGMTLLLERERVIAALDAAGIVAVGVRL